MFDKGSAVYGVGIKGTGLSALAELLTASGVRVSGSDTADVFYTDAVLKALGIPYHETFSADNIPADTELVIHSAAYTAENNVEVAEAVRRGLPLMRYPDALGAWSARFESAGIAGVHGKTTTAALCGTLVQAANLPAQVLVGSAVPSFERISPPGGGGAGRSTLYNGSRFFIAETCEYRRHFLAFHPAHIVLTAVESDHQDYFPDYASILNAFVEYGMLLPEGGSLIYCADDAGASGAAGIIAEKKPDITVLPYGFSAAGDFRLEWYRVENEKAVFKIACFDEPFRLSIPGRYNALNTAGALMLIRRLAPEAFVNTNTLNAMRNALSVFRGSKRRQEILGEKNGILFMDDYAHHPTAIAATLRGLKEFFPARRRVVSFMSHTYTRTAALLDEFAASFDEADIVILHKIYASAREHYEGGVDGRTLYEKTKARNKNDVYYMHEHEDSAPEVRRLLQHGDLFITMGAGDNWKLGAALWRNG